MTVESRRSRVPESTSSLRWWRMAQKELREILRDRRTIITLVGMPLLIYPLLGVTFQKLLFTQAAKKNATEYRVAFAAEKDARIFRRLFDESEMLQSEQSGEVVPLNRRPAGTIDDPIWQFMVSNDKSATVDVHALVADRTADVGVRLKEGGDEGPWKFELSYRAESPYSLDARRILEERMHLANEMLVLKRLREQNPPLKLPVTTSLKPIATEESAAPFSIATLIPLILILMTVTGAVYPAIDLTAGERERGTMEALISAPVPRHELLFAKFIAVLTVALLTAVANLVSMVITAYAGGMEQLLFGSGGITLRMLVLILGLLVVFAGFFASVILILTSFARSFKEAQAYLIPVMLVSLAPGVLCLLPGMEMTGWTSVTPLVNIVILARDIFDGRVQSIWVLTTLLSTVLYSAVALAAAARIFGTDAVLYGSEGNWADLIRRPRTRRPAASLSQAMFCLAVMFPAFLILKGIPGRLFVQWIEGRLIGNAVLTIALFAIGPLLLARWTGVDWRRGFRLKGAPAATYVATALLGLSLWPFAYELELQTIAPDQFQAMHELFQQIKAALDAVPLPVKLVTTALVPAICEELFFRGYLLTALRTGMSTVLAVLLSSCLFGLFHVIAMNSLMFERFVPTCFLGLILAWICVRTGSTYPGMLLHTLHNGLLLSLSSFTRELTALGIGAETQEHLPAKWILTASVMVVTGLAILVLSTRRPVVVAAPAQS
ncbi:ABC transporter permease subunit/CPBP intramembrane protease [Schlesneria sp.]|uniref:ABC transporter permease subunit/CPBP intramembrane protease n=1 Tax=Schlesneria sp. TaxID=2762018 RepID=UPI002EFFE434